MGLIACSCRQVLASPPKTGPSAALSYERIANVCPVVSVLECERRPIAGYSGEKNEPSSPPGHQYDADEDKTKKRGGSLADEKEIIVPGTQYLYGRPASKHVLLGNSFSWYLVD